MDAWIDCLTYEDDGMTAYLMDSAAFVNWRRIEVGKAPILALSYR